MEVDFMINLHDTKMMKIPSISQHPDGFFDQFFWPGKKRPVGLLQRALPPITALFIHLTGRYS